MSELDKTLSVLGADNALNMTKAQNEVTAQIEEAKETAWRLRKASTVYSVNDKVIFPGKSNYDKLLKCTTAGTTGAAALSYSSVGIGDTVTDGSVIWTCVALIDTSDPTIVNNITNALIDNSSFNQEINNVVNQAVNQSPASNPAGAIIAFSGSGNIPNGYLLCDGSAISRTTYSTLFSAIGTTYGAGDGSATFNIPDFRGKFLRGYLNGTTAEIGTAQADEIKSHTHSISPAQSIVYTTGNAENSNDSNSGGLNRQDMAIGATGGSETRPTNYAIQYLIKY